MGIYNSKKSLLLKLAYGIFLLVGVFLTLFFSPSVISFYQLGKACGTLALSCLTLQLWMGARVKLIEKGVGLDNILKWHSMNARATLVFIILHPTLMFGPFLVSGKMTIASVLGQFSLYHWMGITAFLLVILTAAVTIYQSRLKINYEHWKIIHKVGYVIILLGFTHSIFVGSDIVSRRPLYYWWIFLVTLTAVAFIYRYVVRTFLLRTSLYKIVKVVKESDDVRSIYFNPVNGKIFSFFPGQFAFVRFYTKHLSSEEHHFTLSSSPFHNPISFTVKESGDFTSQLDRLKKGDMARIEGPFGAFSNAGMQGPFVFIAGGIGITPLMSMLRFMKDTNKKEKTLLFYSAKTKKDLVFFHELERMRNNERWLTVRYILTQKVQRNRKDGFYQGRITPQLLEKHIKNFSLPKFFVVGPDPMMEEIQNMLVELGARKQFIFTERFALK